MINLGLKRITRLLQHISQTELQQPRFNPPWKAVHIAGTNGKGSVAAYLSALLQRQGHREDGNPLRVGRFTSPHFIDRWDCIWINDQPVAKDVFLRTERDVKALARRVEEELRDEARYAFPGKDAGEEPSTEQIDKDARPTEFEILTATAFAIFSQRDPVPCDIAIIECGLGGRLDATNVLPDSAIAVSIITSIGLDHLDMLGGSLKSIVKEKCGIVRKDVPVVIDAGRRTQTTDMVEAEIEARFGHKQIVSNGDAFAQLMMNTLGEEQVDRNGDPSREDFLHRNRTTLLNLLPHQRSNFALALTAYKYAAGLGTKQGKSSSYEDSRTLYEDIMRDASQSYPARLQLLRPGWLKDTDTSEHLSMLNDTEVLLDGAHNTQSAQVLRDFVDKKVLTELSSAKRGGDDKSQIKPEIWIIALSSTKPPAEILSALFTAQIPATDQDRKRMTNGSFTPPEPTRIIFTSFGPVDGMPWVKPASTDALVQCANELGLSPNIEAITGNIVEALGAVQKVLAEWKEYSKGSEEQEPLVAIAGSLYLCGDFLRVVRDGREAFWRHLNKSVSHPRSE